MCIEPKDTVFRSFNNELRSTILDYLKHFSFIKTMLSFDQVFDPAIFCVLGVFILSERIEGNRLVPTDSVMVNQPPLLCYGYPPDPYKQPLVRNNMAMYKSLQGIYPLKRKKEGESSAINVAETMTPEDPDEDCLYIDENTRDANNGR